MEDEIKKLIENYYDSYFSINAIYEKLAKMHGLTSTSLFTLYIIRDHPEECTQHLICEKLLFPKQTVNAILDSFEKKGLIYKKVSTHDKRLKIIMLTEEGHQYVNKIWDDMVYLEETAFTNMEAKTREAMIHGEQSFLEQLTLAFDTLEQKK